MRRKSAVASGPQQRLRHLRRHQRWLRLCRALRRLASHWPRQMLAVRQRPLLRRLQQLLLVVTRLLLVVTRLLPRWPLCRLR